MLEMEGLALVRSHQPFWSPQQSQVPSTAVLAQSPEHVLPEQDPEPRRDLSVDLELGAGVRAQEMGENKQTKH